MSAIQRQGGDLLKQKTIENLRSLEKGFNKPGLIQFFSFKHDFANEWYQFVTTSEGQAFKATIKKTYFPYLAQSRNITIEKAILYTIEDGELLPSGNTGLNVSDTLNLQEINDDLNDKEKLEAEFSLSENDVLRRNKDVSAFLIFYYKV